MPSRLVTGLSAVCRSRAAAAGALALLTAIGFACSEVSNGPVEGAAVVQLVVNPDTVELDAGQQAAFSAFGRLANGDSISVTPSWSASGGTISPTGVFTADSVPGWFEVIAEAGSGTPPGHATVHVRPSQVTALFVVPADAEVTAGHTRQFDAYARTDAGDSVAVDVTWSASGGSITPDGLYTAGFDLGQFRVIAVAGHGRNVVADTATVTIVAEPHPIAKVTVAPSEASLLVGDSIQLTATALDSAGNPLDAQPTTWTSLAADIATVSDSGVVRGIAEGITRIIADAAGHRDTATVTVSPVPVAAVSIQPSSATLVVGDTARLTATPEDSAGHPLSGRTVEWSSSDSAVAAVDAGGLVTGRAPGSAAITATSEGQSATATVTVQAAPAGFPSFGHVFVVVEENTDYADVIGNASMPYLNGLAAEYGLATEYYANTHPSIGNYFMLATGQIITNNDSYSTVVDVDNVVRRLLAAGKTWKSYAEDLPSVGYTGGDVGGYARKHNVYALLSDVVNDATQRARIVPFTQFPTDLANGTLPDFSNIVPNLCHDAHDCPLATADQWLEQHIGPLIASPTFQQDGLLIIVFDEAGSDNTHGGGRVACVVVSPRARQGYQSTTLYQHESVLRLVLQGLGITTFPGAATSAREMSEFFLP